MELTIPFSARGLRKLVYLLIAAGAGLSLLHLVIKATAAELPWGPIEAVFDLDEEISIPTWFSSVQLFLIGLVLGLSTLVNGRRTDVPNWLLVAGAATFFLVSADEGAMLHERITYASRRLELDFLLIEGHGAWILPYVLLASAALLIALRPLIRIAKTFPMESSIAVAGVTLIGTGALGIELMSYFVFPERDGLWYELSVALEEGLEMTGASLILYASLRLSVGIAPTARVR